MQINRNMHNVLLNSYSRLGQKPLETVLAVTQKYTQKHNHLMPFPGQPGLMVAPLTLSLQKKVKLNICYSQVHGVHQAASHIPALNLPNRSRYSNHDYPEHAVTQDV